MSTLFTRLSRHLNSRYFAPSHPSDSDGYACTPDAQSVCFGDAAYGGYAMQAQYPAPTYAPSWYDDRAGYYAANGVAYSTCYAEQTAVYSHSTAM